MFQHAHALLFFVGTRCALAFGNERGGPEEDAAAKAKAEEEAAAAAAAKKEEEEGSDKETDHEAESAKWKALARKHEAQSKANADKAKKFDESEEANKSEAEKAAAKAADAEKRALEAEQRALRLEVASDKGLTAAQAKRLVGATKEELEEDADELLESFKPDEKDDKSPTGGRPKERLKSGAKPDSEPDETDPAKIVENVPRF